MSIPRQTLWSQTQKAAGCCTSCGSPRTFGKTLCEKHLREQGVRMRAYNKLHPKGTGKFVSFPITRRAA